MKQVYIVHENHPKLLLLFAGWAADETPFKQYRPKGMDYMVCYDYRTLDFDKSIFDRYQRVNVVTWSMGVWVGSLILSNIPQNKILSIAFNGSISPIDNLEGIPLKTYQATLDGLTPASLQKFMRRMCKDSNAEMHGSIEKKDIYNEKDEDKFQEYYDKYNYEYDYVFIGNNDRIFPPENLRINNESPVHSNVILTDNAHYDEPMFRFLLQDMWEMTVDDFICHLKTINIDETIEE